MISTNFQHIRKLLLDPSQEGHDNRAIAKITCVALKVIALAEVCYSAFSVFNGGAVWPAIVSGIVNREVFVIADNFVNILTTPNASVLLPSWFISSLLKDTWIAGTFFKDLF